MVNSNTTNPYFTWDVWCHLTRPWVNRPPRSFGNPSLILPVIVQVSFMKTNPLLDPWKKGKLNTNSVTYFQTITYMYEMVQYFLLSSMGPLFSLMSSSISFIPHRFSRTWPLSQHTSLGLRWQMSVIRDVFYWLNVRNTGCLLLIKEKSRNQKKNCLIPVTIDRTSIYL